MIDVLCFGDINVDALMDIPAYPEPGGDAMASQVILRPGGSVANTAIVLARLGLKVKMIARVGADAWADLALAPLHELGVDLSAVTRDPDEATGLIFIPVTSGGERTMFSYRGANTRTPVEAISATVMGSPRFVHISAYNFLKSPQREAAWRLVELAQAARLPLSMDVGVEPSRNAHTDLLALLPQLDLVVLGQEEAQTLIGTDEPGQICQILLERGAKNVGLKLGRQGCQVASKHQRLRLPGLEVVTVDTTGAGDAFCAGMIFGLLADLPLPACGLLANTLGALATTVWGGGPVLPAKAEVVQYLSKAFLPNQKPEFQEWGRQVLTMLQSTSNSIPGAKP